MSENKYSSHLALITGASSGIGEATAVRLARQGIHVILTARRADRLKKVAGEISCRGGRVDWISADLAQENERQRLWQEVNSRFGCPHILVNNAGLGWYGYYASMPWKTVHQMLAVNVEAMLHLTHLFLPGMQRRGSGQVIFIGSIVGQIPSQGVAVYAATKGLLDSFTTALHREMRRSGVHICLVRPGSVRTEFYEAAAASEAGGHIPSEGTGITAERVAGAVWSLVRRPRRVVYVPPILGLVPWVEVLFGWLMDWIGPLLLKNNYKAGNSGEPGR